MIHYHGTPLTPRLALQKMAGKNFCVSFADPRDADWCATHGQSVMWDNGAFSLFTQGKQVDWHRFYDWVETRLSPVNWAIVPDVIDGDIDANYALAEQWPFDTSNACVVWHMHEPVEHIGRLLDLGFGKVAFGSSGQYWEVGGPTWERRADEAFNFISQRGPLPWVHMLRGLDLCGDRWPFSSADSVNVARNYKDRLVCPERMARRIDSVQCPTSWDVRATQQDFFNQKVAAS